MTARVGYVDLCGTFVQHDAIVMIQPTENGMAELTFSTGRNAVVPMSPGDVMAAVARVAGELDAASRPVRGSL